MTYEDGINWNEYALGYDARLRGDAYDKDRSEDWRLGWKDCDAECGREGTEADSEG